MKSFTLLVVLFGVCAMALSQVIIRPSPRIISRVFRKNSLGAGALYETINPNGDTCICKPHESVEESVEHEAEPEYSEEVHYEPEQHHYEPEQHHYEPEQHHYEPEQHYEPEEVHYEPEEVHYEPEEVHYEPDTSVSIEQSHEEYVPEQHQEYIPDVEPQQCINPDGSIGVSGHVARPQRKQYRKQANLRKQANYVRKQAKSGWIY